MPGGPGLSVPPADDKLLAKMPSAGRYQRSRLSATKQRGIRASGGADSGVVMLPVPPDKATANTQFWLTLGVLIAIACPAARRDQRWPRAARHLRHQPARPGRARLRRRDHLAVLRLDTGSRDCRGRHRRPGSTAAAVLASTRIRLRWLHRDWRYHKPRMRTRMRHDDHGDRHRSFTELGTTSGGSPPS